MTQFNLNDNKPLRVSDFVEGYIEAMFFTNGDTGYDVEDLLNELGTRRLTRKALASITSCCRFFQRDQRNVLFAAYENGTYDEKQAGRDFWFTRQGHGVGYWDRDELASIPGGIADLLTQHAEFIGPASIEVYKGWIHHTH